MSVYKIKIFLLSRNDKFDWVRCPFTGWNQGWEADKGLGHWLEDNTFKTTCYSGDQVYILSCFITS